MFEGSAAAPLELPRQEPAMRGVLSGGAHPHFTTVNAFRLEHREALAALFVQVLQLCSRAGLSTVGHVSLDGSKIAASASKHKAMSYGRMKQEEQRLARDGCSASAKP